MPLESLLLNREKDYLRAMVSLVAFNGANTVLFAQYFFPFVMTA
jgi:hypothetical protein